MKDLLSSTDAPESQVDFSDVRKYEMCPFLVNKSEQHVRYVHQE